MRTLVCLVALAVAVAAPALAKPRHSAGWQIASGAGYARPDYTHAGPAPVYLAPNAYAPYAATGAHTYRYNNGVRVWYGSVPAYAPVLANASIIAPAGPAITATASPGPRLYVHPNGVRVWYGPNQ